MIFKNAASFTTVLALCALAYGCSSNSGGDLGGGAVDAGRPSGDAGKPIVDAGGGPPDAGVVVPPASASGRSAAALVPGGTSAKSANYSVVMTLGQSPGGNVKMTSPKSTVTPGVVGATQTQ